MLIYLDANLVVYIAKNEDFIFQRSDACKVVETKLQREVHALRCLVELDQYADWKFAAPMHLLNELHSGRPTEDQRTSYKMLKVAWLDTVAPQDEPTESEISCIEKDLQRLNLKDSTDQRHLAEALARGASWFLTNDREIVRKTRGRVGTMRVSRPSECLEEISVGLFLR